MVIKNFKSFIDQRFSAFLVAFLMGNLILSFAVGPIYYGFEKIPLPWAFLFFGLYYAGIHAIGGGKERMLRPLVLISLFIFLFLCLFSSLIFLLPLSKSSPARSLLWQKPMNGWLRFYQFFLLFDLLFAAYESKIKSWFLSLSSKKLQTLFIAIFSYRRFFIPYVVGVFYALGLLRNKSLCFLLGAIFTFESIQCIRYLICLLPSKKITTLPPIAISDDPITLIYWILLSFFSGICLFTNLLVVRHIQVGSFAVTAGVFTYPFTFLFVDIITELFGKEKAKESVFCGLISNIYGLFSLSLIAFFLKSEDQFSFWETFGFIEASFFASIIAYIIAQHISIHLFSMLRKATKGRYLWLRNNVTTILSQGIDTALFGSIIWGLWQLMPNHNNNTSLTLWAWIKINGNEYLAKIILALLDTPLLYGALAFFYWLIDHLSKKKKNKTI